MYPYLLILGETVSRRQSGFQRFLEATIVIDQGYSDFLQVTIFRKRSIPVDPLTSRNECVAEINELNNVRGKRNSSQRLHS